MRRKKRTGAVLVEMALVLPLVLLIFCSIIEFSRLLMLRHSADAAAYEAARAAIVVGATRQQAEDAAEELLSAARVRDWQVSVEPQSITEYTPRVAVKIDVPVASNAWISPFFFRDSVVSSTVSLVTERPSNVQLTGLPSRQQIIGINVGGLGL